MRTKIRLGKDRDIVRISEMIGRMKNHVEIAEGTTPKNWSVEKIVNHVRRRLHLPNRYFYVVADVGDDIIGVIEGKIISGRRGYLAKGYVEQTYRRRGVMRQLESRFTQILKSRGISQVDLEVQCNNKEGMATWTSLGYQTVEKVFLRATIKERRRKCIEF